MRWSAIRRKLARVDKAIDRAIDKAEVAGAVVLARMPRDGEVIEHASVRGLAVASLGTPWEICTEGRILLLEEVHERPYRVDRMLQQLRSAGKLDGVVGIGFGDLSSCTDDKYDCCVEDVVREYALQLDCPCVAGLPFGHVVRHATWPVGGRASIDGDRGEIRILERVVEVPT